MAATGTPTTNLGLRIMNGTDPVDVADINANSQTLDDKIGAVPSNTSVQAQITSANEALSRYTSSDGTLKYINFGNVREINESGRYYMSGNVQNLPTSAAHYVDVYVYSTEDGGYKHLVACRQNDGVLFTCKCSAGVWTEWQELALNSNIGTIVTGTSSGGTSTTSGTRTEVGSITLTAGTWIVCGMIDWEANGNGYRQATFDTVDTDNPSRSNTSCIMAVTTASKQTYQQVVRILPVVSSQSEVKFYGKQNSGGTLYAYPYIYAVRII